MVNALRLSRQQIAQIVGNDPEAIKQFEKLFSVNREYFQSGEVDAAITDAGSALAVALQALGETATLSDRISALEIMPPDSTLDWRGLATGWGRYVNTAGSQALSAATQVTLVNNAGIVEEGQKPADIDTFYNGSVIKGQLGDALLITISFTFTPSGPSASIIHLAIDAGGMSGEVHETEVYTLKGAGLPHKISYNVTAGVNSDWAANGGTVRIEADDAGDVTEVEYTIARVHRALY